MSLRHLGMVADGVEDTSSDAVTSWAPAYETYRLTALPDGGTRVTVEQDVQPGQESMMEPVWSRALADLKALCEADA